MEGALLQVRQPEAPLNGSRQALRVDLLTTYANRTSVLEKLSNTLSGVMDRLGDLRFEPEAPARHRRLTDEQVAELAARYESGETRVALAERFGVDKSTVSKLLKSAGVKMRYRAIDPDDHAEVIRLYESGMTQAEVGEVFGSGPNPIGAILRQHGVPRRRAGPRKRI